MCFGGEALFVPRRLKFRPLRMRSANRARTPAGFSGLRVSIACTARWKPRKNSAAASWKGSSLNSVIGSRNILTTSSWGSGDTQDPKKFEEMIVPRMGPVVPVTFFLAVWSVGLVCPLHKVHRKLNEPRRQVSHRQSDQMADQRTLKTCSSTYWFWDLLPGSSLSSSVGPPIRIPSARL